MRIPYPLLILVLLLLPGFAISQNWQWAEGNGGIGNDVADAITTDPDGNVYITGYMDGIFDYDDHAYNSFGLNDVFIAKYSAGGQLQWLRIAGSRGDDRGEGIRYKNGFIYLCGTFSDTIFFNGGQVISHGGSDAFVAKFDANGSFIWAKGAGGPWSDLSTSLDVDADGNIFVGGTYNANIYFDTLHLSTTNFYAESFYAKYNNNGQLQWAKTVKGTGTNLITGAAVDNNGGAVFSGFFGNSFTAGGTNIQSHTTSYDIFTLAVDANGNTKWLNRAGSSYEDAGEAVWCDSKGNAYVTGYFSGTAHFGNDSITYGDFNNVFLVKYDTGGTEQWVREGKDYLTAIAFGITGDRYGNVYLTGLFQGVLTFGSYQTTAQSKDIFVVSYTSDGYTRWLSRAGGVETAGALGIAIGGNDNLSVCGYYNVDCVLGNLRLKYSNNIDALIANLRQPSDASGLIDPEVLNAKVYPNPATGQHYLHIETPGNYQPVLFELSNLPGQLISTAVFEQSTELQLGALSKGIYLLKLTSGSKSKTLKVVVE